MLVVLGWAAALDAFTLWTMFQGLLLPQNVNGGGLQPEVLAGNPTVLGIFYLGILGSSVLASLVLADLGSAILSFFASYSLAAILTFVTLILPDVTGIYNDPSQLLTGAAVGFTFTAYFPFPLLIELVGTLLGVGLAERLL